MQKTIFSVLLFCQLLPKFSISVNTFSIYHPIPTKTNHDFQILNPSTIHRSPSLYQHNHQYRQSAAGFLSHQLPFSYNLFSLGKYLNEENQFKHNIQPTEKIKLFTPNQGFNRRPETPGQVEEYRKYLKEEKEALEKENQQQQNEVGTNLDDFVFQKSGLLALDFNKYV